MKNFIILLCLFLISSLNLDAQEKQASSMVTNKDTVIDGVRTLLCAGCKHTKVKKDELFYMPIDSSLITNEWLGVRSLSFVTCGVTYKKPYGLKEVTLTYDACSRRADKGHSYPFYLEKILLASNDNEFIAYGPKLGQYDPLRSVGLGTFNVYGDEILEVHLSQMRGVLRKYFGKDVDWLSMIQFYPDEIAKKRFNADAAIRVSFNLHPEDYTQPNDGTKEYKYVDVLMIQKDKRGDLGFYCLYTDEGKKNLNKYWKKIEKASKFEKKFVKKAEYNLILQLKQ